MCVGYFRTGPVTEESSYCPASPHCVHFMCIMQQYVFLCNPWYHCQPTFFSCGGIGALQVLLSFISCVSCSNMFSFAIRGIFVNQHSSLVGALVPCKSFFRSFHVYHAAICFPLQSVVSLSTNILLLWCIGALRVLIVCISCASCSNMFSFAIRGFFVNQHTSFLWAIAFGGALVS